MKLSLLLKRDTAKTRCDYARMVIFIATDIVAMYIIYASFLIGATVASVNADNNGVLSLILAVIIVYALMASVRINFAFEVELPSLTVVMPVIYMLSAIDHHAFFFVFLMRYYNYTVMLANRGFFNESGGNSAKSNSITIRNPA